MYIIQCKIFLVLRTLYQTGIDPTGRHGTILRINQDMVNYSRQTEELKISGKMSGLKAVKWKNFST